jgi:hypothetical protein
VRVRARSAEVLHLLGLAGDRLDEGGRAVVGGEQRQVAADPAQHDQHARGDRERDHSDAEGNKDEDVADRRVEGHAAQGSRD